jgi:hypothetical protein
MILSELTCLVGGIVIGMAVKQERLHNQYQKTYEEVDQQVRKDLVYYKNLSESLKQDLHYLKTKK